MEHKTIDIDSNKKNITFDFKGIKKIVNYDVLVITTGLKDNGFNLNSDNSIFISPFTTPENLKNILDFISSKKPKHITLIGSGFVNLEIADNLKYIGIEVSIVEISSKIMGKNFDDDIQPYLYSNLIKNLDLNLKTEVDYIKNKKVFLKNGKSFYTDGIIYSIGGPVNKEIFKKTKIAFGSMGGIKTDKWMKTNIDSIFAAGDVIETFDFMGNPTRSSMATVANYQGKLVGYNIDENTEEYRGTLLSSSIEIFGEVFAKTGLTEKDLNRLKIKYKKIIVKAPQISKTFKNAKDITMKIIFDKTGIILGSQAIGPKTTEKKLPVLL
ncbi:MAG: FAD-dependent oxidoreductase [Mollicutes bacterium PWAP]|nr:FAD-dependent oxidoreductase [Mollicutes bacterium PWAP]